MEMAQVRKRTRARAAALATGAAAAAAAATSTTSPKKRKTVINNTNQDQDQDQFMFSPSSFVQLMAMSTTSTSSSGAPAPEEERCSTPTFDDSPASCCSSNGYSFDLHEKRITKFSDPEVESAQVEETTTCDCGDQIIRREVIMSLSSELRTNSQEVKEEKKPTTKKTESRCILSTTPQKMPTDSELEEFFSAAEKDIQKRFSYKYNYDIVKDVPLEGRYEWVQLKP